MFYCPNAPINHMVFSVHINCKHEPCTNTFWVIETVEERVKTACQGLKNVKNSREQAIFAKSISGEIHEASPRLMTHPTLAFGIHHY